MIKIKDNLLSSKIESFIDENKTNYSEVESLILKRIMKDDDCSIYYTGLKVLLFGIEEKPVDDILNTRNIFYAS